MHPNDINASTDNLIDNFNLSIDDLKNELYVKRLEKPLVGYWGQFSSPRNYLGKQSNGTIHFFTLHW